MSKAEKTRQYIVEKTAPLFNSKGFAGTSLSDMTEATGLTKGSIYGNFSNKDEVALAVFEYNLQQVNAITNNEINKRTTYKDKLLVFADVYAGFLKAPFPFGGCPVLNTAVEADDTHPLLRERAAAAVHQWKLSIVKLVKKGMEEKEFNKEADPEHTAIAMIAMIEGGIMLTKLTGKTNYLNAVVKSIRQLIDGLE